MNRMRSQLPSSSSSGSGCANPGEGLGFHASGFRLWNLLYMYSPMEMGLRLPLSHIGRYAVQPIRLLCSFWSAWCWASRHRDLSCAPVYLGVMFHEPHVLEDNCSLANSHNVECRPFRVVFVLDYQVNNLGDMSCFIGSPIYVVDQDCSRQLMGLYVL